MSFLENISPDQVRAHPFPHVVVENVIDQELCDQLIAQFPQQEIIAGTQRHAKTTKYYLNAEQSQRDSRVTPLWKQTLLDLVQPNVWHSLVRIFGDSLLREYPDFEGRYGALSGFRIGNRRQEDFSNKDVLLDSKALIHTPVFDSSEIERLPHLKDFRTVFLAYLFLRPDDDKSEGADFDFYSVRPGKPILLGPRQTAKPVQLKLETRVPYRKNTLVMFLNTPRSFQGVTARSASVKPYVALHFTAHLPSRLYNPRSSVAKRLSYIPRFIGKKLRSRRLNRIRRA